MNAKAKLVLSDANSGKGNPIAARMVEVTPMAAWVNDRWQKFLLEAKANDDAVGAVDDGLYWYSCRVIALTIDLTALVSAAATHRKVAEKEEPELEIKLAKNRLAFRWWHLKQEYQNVSQKEVAVVGVFDGPRFTCLSTRAGSAGPRGFFQQLSAILLMG